MANERDNELDDERKRRDAMMNDARATPLTRLNDLAEIKEDFIRSASSGMEAQLRRQALGGWGDPAVRAKVESDLLAYSEKRAATFMADKVVEAKPLPPLTTDAQMMQTAADIRWLETQVARLQNELNKLDNTVSDLEPDNSPSNDPLSNLTASGTNVIVRQGTKHEVSGSYIGPWAVRPYPNTSGVADSIQVQIGSKLFAGDGGPWTIDSSNYTKSVSLLAAGDHTLYAKATVRDDTGLPFYGAEPYTWLPVLEFYAGDRTHVHTGSTHDATWTALAVVTIAESPLLDRYVTAIRQIQYGDIHVPVREYILQGGESGYYYPPMYYCTWVIDDTDT